MFCKSADTAYWLWIAILILLCADTKLYSFIHKQIWWLSKYVNERTVKMHLIHKTRSLMQAQLFSLLFLLRWFSRLDGFKIYMIVWTLSMVFVQTVQQTLVSCLLCGKESFTNTVTTSVCVSLHVRETLDDSSTPLRRHSLLFLCQRKIHATHNIDGLQHTCLTLFLASS